MCRTGRVVQRVGGHLVLLYSFFLVLCSNRKGHYANYSLRASSSESREIPRKETRVRGAGFAARSFAINKWLARRLRKLYHLPTLTRQTTINTIRTTTNNFRVYIHLFGGGSDRPDEPDEPVQVGTPLAAPRHCLRDRLRALTAFSATRFASLSTKAKSGLLDSMMTSCFKALCTPIKLLLNLLANFSREHKKSCFKYASALNRLRRVYAKTIFEYKCTPRAKKCRRFVLNTQSDIKI